MRKLYVLGSLLAAVGCGGDSGSSSTSSGVTGTVGGRSFKAVEARAVIVTSGNTPCQITTPIPANVSVSAVAIEFSSYPDACGDLSSPTCQGHANGQNAIAVLAKADATGGPAPTLSPGTFNVSSPLVDAVIAGDAYALSLAMDPACVGTPSDAATAGGTLRVDNVNGPSITGHVDITFQDGSHIAGDFSAPVCGTTPDVCAIVAQQAPCAPPPTPICLP